MNWRVRIKCFFGFHWWLLQMPTDEELAKSKIGPGQVYYTNEICGWCKKVK